MCFQAIIGPESAGGTQFEYMTSLQMKRFYKASQDEVALVNHC